MFCKNCGAPIENDAHYCKVCGTHITQSIPTSKAANPSFFKRKSFRGVIFFLLVVIICVTAYFSFQRYNSSLGYFDNNRWGTSIENFEKKYPAGYEYDKDTNDSKTSFSIPINNFEGVSFDSEETAACIFQDNKFYYVQIFFRTDDPFKDANTIVESLTKKLGTPSEAEPQYGTYRWDTAKSNIEVAVISRTAVAIWFGDISNPHNSLSNSI